MFQRRLTRKWFVTILSVLMIVLAGCQSIGGIDIGKALLNQMTVESMQGKMELAIHLNLTEDAEQWMDPAELAMTKALSDMKIVLDEYKQESWQIQSIKGKISIAAGDIPFHVSLNGAEMVVQLEGVKIPIVIPMDSAYLPSGAPGLGIFGSFMPEEDLLQNKQLLQSMTSFLVKHIPNPPSIRLDSVIDTVNGESVTLYRIHSEIKGPEMLALFKKFILNILKDDAGLKEMISLMYDLLEDSSTGEDNLLNESLFGLDGMMADRELAIEVMHATVKQMLAFMLMLSEDGSDMGMGLSELFTEETGANADLYIDSSLRVRKSNIELTFAPDLLEMESAGLASIKLQMNGEYWNHNQPVKADMIDITDKEVYTLELQSISDPAGNLGNDFIQLLDQESVLYTWLKDDLHLLRKTVAFDVSEYDFSPENEKAHYQDGITYAPAQYFADSLGFELELNSETREATFTDPGSSATLTVTDGSSLAVLNGEQVDMGASAYIFNERMYVPLRYVAESLDATVEWDPIWEIATVTKEI